MKIKLDIEAISKRLEEKFRLTKPQIAKVMETKTALMLIEILVEEEGTLDATVMELAGKKISLIEREIELKNKQDKLQMREEKLDRQREELEQTKALLETLETAEARDKVRLHRIFKDEQRHPTFSIY